MPDPQKGQSSRGGAIASAGAFSTHHTGRILESLAQHEPGTLAIMHGSAYYGKGAQALRDLAEVMREVLGPQA